MSRSFAFVLLASLAAPVAALAQTTPDPAPATDPAPAPAAPADAPMTAPMGANCEADFTALDIDGNGFLTELESQRDVARATIDGQEIGTDGLTRAQFLEICGSESWTQATPEAGAPFEGANSFTEEQAKERATAWNVMDVSPLTLDDQGIWRGTGKVDAAAVSVAIDYKGNVVTTPAAQ